MPYGFSSVLAELAVEVGRTAVVAMAFNLDDQFGKAAEEFFEGRSGQDERLAFLGTEDGGPDRETQIGDGARETISDPARRLGQLLGGGRRDRCARASRCHRAAAGSEREGGNDRRTAHGNYPSS